MNWVAECGSQKVIPSSYKQVGGFNSQTEAMRSEQPMRSIQ